MHKLSKYKHPWFAPKCLHNTVYNSRTLTEKLLQNSFITDCLNDCTVNKSFKVKHETFKRKYLGNSSLLKTSTAKQVMIKTTGRCICIERLVLLKHQTSKKSEVRGLAERWKERSCYFLKDKHEKQKKALEQPIRLQSDFWRDLGWQMHLLLSLTYYIPQCDDEESNLILEPEKML